MTTQIISKNSVKKIGEYLRKTPFSIDVEYLNKLVIVDEWRQEHFLPLYNLRLKLEDWMDELEVDYFSAQRLKRMYQIIRKLKRWEGMSLARMQDIGGCRIIVPQLQLLNTARDHLVKKFERSKTYSLEDIDDYVVNGRSDTGYRAIHLRIYSEERGLKFEVQLRSMVQHYWAEYTEWVSSKIEGTSLKELQGSENMISYFKEMSNILSLHEKNILLKSGEFENFYTKYPETQRELDILHKKYEIGRDSVKDKKPETKDTKKKKQESGIMGYLMAFKKEKEGKDDFLYKKIDKSDYISGKIQQDYYAYEKEYGEYSVEKKYEVVIIGAKSFELVKTTHAHYWGNIDNILQLMKKVKRTAT